MTTVPDNHRALDIIDESHSFGMLVTLDQRAHPSADGLNLAVRDAIADGIGRGGKVVVITGAGVSAESGIPVYRGKNGMWTKGGQESMMMATASFFVEHPRESWQWYLMRRTEMRLAEPNAAHIAIAHMDTLLDGRFMLIGQNIDRLHPRAGSRPETCIELHGHLEGTRCQGRCTGVFPFPAELDGWKLDDELTDDQFALFVCPECDGPTRPHVLWFDEFYESTHYRFDEAQRAVANASLCITAGTSGGVPVAARLAGIAARAGASLIDVNTRDNPLRQLAIQHGGFVSTPATEAMPAIVAAIEATL